MGRAGGGRRRDRLRWSKLYTFSCFRAPSTDEAAGPSAASGSAVGGPGFSRVVHCNNPILHRRKPLKYPTNYISTTKYNVLTFLPKAIFEQFRRVANLYFLLTAILSLTPVNLKAITEAELNYPSLIVNLLAQPITVNRTVTNVGKPNSVYTAVVDMAKEVSVIVQPPMLRFTELKEKQSFTVTVRWAGQPNVAGAEGNLKWVSDDHTVRCPIVIPAKAA